MTFQNHTNRPLTDFGGKTSIFSHPVYLFLREFSLQDFRGGSGSFSSSGGNGGLLSELLILGFNNGPRALSERMLSMLSDSGEAQSQEGIQSKISQYKFSVCPERLQCPPESAQCPITLEIPEEGVFIKNSGDSVVCSLFDVTAFSRLVSEKSPHPLTREKLTASMVVSADKCFYDHGKGSFVIKDS
ncbi:DUF1076 domain-containing protein [Escherichia coli]|nr:DUF1076 domain-containing protein [Escherichia coli]